MIGLLLKIIPLLVVALPLAWTAITRPVIYITLALSYLAVFASAWLSNVHPQFFLFGLNIYPEDLIIGINLFGTYSSGKLTVRKPSNSSARVGFLLMSLTLLGILAWINQYGIKSGVNHWRESLLGFSILFYCLKAGEKWTNQKLAVVIIIPATLLSVLAITKILTSGLGRADGIDPLTGLQTGRPTNASGGFLILAALWICFYLLDRRKFLSVTLILIFASLVLLLQQRSVWVGAIASIAVWIFHRPGGEVKYSRIGRTLVAAPVLGIVYIVTKHSSQLSEASSNTSNLLWRTNRWKDSLAIQRSPIQWIFGSIFGPTPVTAQGGPFTTAAHSAYIASVENFGLVGLFLLVLLFILPLLAKSTTSANTRLVEVTMIFASMAYGLTYTFTPTSFAVLGLFMAYRVQNDERTRQLNPAIDVNVQKVQK